VALIEVNFRCHPRHRTPIFVSPPLLPHVYYSLQSSAYLRSVRVRTTMTRTRQVGALGDPRTCTIVLSRLGGADGICVFAMRVRVAMLTLMPHTSRSSHFSRYLPSDGHYHRLAPGASRRNETMRDHMLALELDRGRTRWRLQACDHSRGDQGMSCRRRSFVSWCARAFTVLVKGRRDW
jgi:hypothetical protein